MPFLLLTVKVPSKKNWSVLPTLPHCFEYRIIVRKLQLVVASFARMLSHGNIPSHRRKAIQHGTKQILGQRVLNNMD